MNGHIRQDMRAMRNDVDIDHPSAPAGCAFAPHLGFDHVQGMQGLFRVKLGFAEHGRIYKIRPSSWRKTRGAKQPTL